MLAYYRRSAPGYEARHCDPGDEHGRALGQVIGHLQRLGCESVLDTGCGTGRAMRAVIDALPGCEVRGNDLSTELVEVATDVHGIDRDAIEIADSADLPYGDRSFDAVLATGVMHHVPEPDRVIAEMLRVARKAIFISDTNIYGRGNPVARLGKLTASRLGLLRPINRMRRGGHEWFFSEGDGVAWSYSVFDSLRQIQRSCEEAYVIPTAPQTYAAQALPLVAASHCLVCGVLPGPAQA